MNPDLPCSALNPEAERGRKGAGWVKSLRLSPVTPIREVTRTQRQHFKFRSVVSVTTETASALKGRIPPAEDIPLEMLSRKSETATQRQHRPPDCRV